VNIIELTKKAVELASKDEKIKERTKDTVTSIVMILKNEEEHSFTFAVNKGKLEFLEERIADPDFQFEMSEKDYSDLMTGNAYGMVLMAAGKMKMTKGSWAQIGKIATPLGMIPKAGKKIVAKEKSKTATPLAVGMKKRSAKHIQSSCEGLEAVNIYSESVLESIPDGVIVTDLEGNITAVNKAILRKNKRTKEEVIGKFAPEVFVKPQDIEKFMKYFSETLEKGYVGPFEGIGIAKDGTEIPTIISVSLLKDAEGNPYRFFCVVRDITELKRAEEKRETVIEAMPDPLIVLNLNGVILSVNPAYTKMFGWKPEERIGKSFYKLGESLKAKDIEKFMKLLGKLIEKGDVEPVETVIRMKDGREIPMSVTYSLIKDAEGNPKNIIALLRDITETKKLISELEEAKATLEDKVKERTANLSALQEINTVLAGTMDLKETLNLILESLEKKLGYVFTSMILVNREKNCLDNYMPGPSVPVEKVVKMVGLDFTKVSVPLTAKENMVVQAVLTGEPQFTHDLYDYARPVVEKRLIAPVQKMLGIKLVGTVPLIAEKKVVGVLSFARKTEEPLTEEEMGILMTFVNHAGLAIERAKIYRDLKESKAELQEKLEQLDKTTRALEEAKNYTDSIIKSMIDTLIVVSPQGNILTVNAATCTMLGYEEKELIGQSIEKIFVEEEEEEEEEEELVFKGTGIDDLIKKGFISNVEKTYLTKDGRKMPVLFSGSAMRDDDGKIRGIVCVALDITERKRAEEQLLQSEKLGGMGLLAGSIAHELGNPLSIMSSTLQYVQDALLNTGNRQLIEGIDMIMDSIKQMHELLRSLSEFSRPRRPHFESTDLRRILSRVLSFIQKEAETHKIKVRHQFDENLPNCQVDPGEIKQLFLNLFKNAIEAMPDGGELRVRMYLLDSKDVVCIEVSDTGPGISETDLRSIFRPFYSTKPGGTGLGLSFCRHVVEEHGGEITVKSELSKGSIFSIILPVRQKEIDKLDE